MVDETLMQTMQILGPIAFVAVMVTFIVWDITKEVIKNKRTNDNTAKEIESNNRLTRIENKLSDLAKQMHNKLDAISGTCDSKIITTRNSIQASETTIENKLEELTNRILDIRQYSRAMFLCLAYQIVDYNTAKTINKIFILFDRNNLHEKENLQKLKDNIERACNNCFQDINNSIQNLENNYPVSKINAYIGTSILTYAEYIEVLTTVLDEIKFERIYNEREQHYFFWKSRLEEVTKDFGGALIAVLREVI